MRKPSAVAGQLLAYLVDTMPHVPACMSKTVMYANQGVPARKTGGGGRVGAERGCFAKPGSG
jgi:hypothetical protein